MQHTSFYHVTEPDFDALNQFGTTDRTKLKAFLADEGHADMRVFENGDDITVKLAREMLAELAWDENPSAFVEAFCPDADSHNGPDGRERRGVKVLSQAELVG